MTTDHIDLGEQICWSNLAKTCHDREVRRIQQSGLRNGGVNMVGRMLTEASSMKTEEWKQAEAPKRSDPVTRGPEAHDFSAESPDKDDTQGPTRSPRKIHQKSPKTGDSLSKDSKASTCEGRNEKYSRTKRPKELRSELSGIAHELLELRLHMMKEEERFRLQEQNLVNRRGQRGKASKPDGRTKREKLKGQEEQRRRQRSPLRNQTNIIIDDLKGKVGVLLQQRREMREQDRLLRLQLDEVRAQWEVSVQQVELARLEKAKLKNKIASVVD